MTSSPLTSPSEGPPDGSRTGSQGAEENFSPPSPETPVFEPLYFADRLQMVNPRADVGVVTLWTPLATAVDVLGQLAIDLDPETSRIAVIGTLYGDGLPQMVRNLLWNPQIRHLLVFGQDLSGSAAELEALLTRGVEPIERLGQPRFRILGTHRTLDSGFPPEALVGQVTVTRFGKPSTAATRTGLQAWFQRPPPVLSPSASDGRRERVLAPLKTEVPAYFPSEPRAHTIVRRRPLDAWEDIVHRILRFGIPSLASEKKKRLELQNLKAVITEPEEEEAQHLAAYGFSQNRLHAYQTSLLSGDLPEGVAYSYGNRLRAHWQRPDGTPLDSLIRAAAELRRCPTSRHAYISLWDPLTDFDKQELHSNPCLVSVFFRLFQDRLTLTASFRAHNTMSAWLTNVYGLMAVQRFVAKEAGGLAIGAITILSLSISIDPTAPDALDLAQQIAAARRDDSELDRSTGKRSFREDPNGYFVVTLDPETDEIVADLKADGETLVRYRGRTAEAVEAQISRDEAVSVLSHALFVGRELGLHEARLRARRAAGKGTVSKSE